jgi:hypothetical protein
MKKSQTEKFWDTQAFIGLGAIIACCLGLWALIVYASNEPLRNLEKLKQLRITGSCDGYILTGEGLGPNSFVALMGNRYDSYKFRITDTNDGDYEMLIFEFMTVDTYKYIPKYNRYSNEINYILAQKE